MDCGGLFYETTYKRFFEKKNLVDSYAKRVSPIPERDPILIPGHFANNLTIEGEPIDTKTWMRPALDAKPEEYLAFVEKLKVNKKPIHDRYFSSPAIDLKPSRDAIKYSKLSTYGSSYSPDYYVSRKEDLKWRRLQLDTSMFKYQETLSRTYFSRIEEMPEFRQLARPFHYPHEEDQLKKELRAIANTNQSAYYLHYCDMRIPKMKALLEDGKMWKDPLDKYTNRKVGLLVHQKKDTPVRNRVL